MDTIKHIINNSDISFLLKSYQDFSAFYNFLQNYFYQDTQHLQKSPNFSDNTSIEKKIIVNIPFLLNSQVTLKSPVNGMLVAIYYSSFLLYFPYTFL